MLLTATAHVFKLQAIYFYTQIFVRDGLAVVFGLKLCRIWRDHGRDFSWITSGSDGNPSGLTEIPQNPEFLSRWDHGKSRRDWGGIGISPGSHRDPAKSRDFIPLGSQ